MANTKIHKVPLADASGVRVPDDLRQRFWYEPDEKCLCFDGFMSKSLYDRLRNLSDDWEYQSAIDELFRICVPEGETESHDSSNAIVVSAVTIGILTVIGWAIWRFLLSSGR